MRWQLAMRPDILLENSGIALAADLIVAYSNICKVKLMGFIMNSSFLE
jgi:hypothetical protein